MNNAMHVDLINNIFPRSSKYHPDLIKTKSVGGNVLYSLEGLTNFLNLKPGMKALDLGCGKALSSVFLAKEFDMNVWAVDNFFSPTDNFEFIKSENLQDKVFPLSLNALNLSFADNFFDCIIVVNSYSYFGTSDKYLPYISRFLKPQGQLGICDICFRQEIDEISDIPDFLKEDFFNYWYHIHSSNWWRQKWQKTGLVAISTSSEVNDQQYNLLREAYINFHQDNPNEAFAKALLLDANKTISFFNLVGLRTSKEAWLEDNFI